MNSISKTRLTGIAAALVFSLGLVLAEGPAKAATETCTISAVSFQQKTDSPGEALVIYCNNYTSFHMAFIGSPSASACNVDIGTAQGMQAIALAARLAGVTLTINYTPTTCVGKTIRIISSVAF